MYVDGFVLPVPKRSLQAYVHLAKKAAKIWRATSHANIAIASIGKS